MNLQGPLLMTRLAFFGLAAPWLLAGVLYLGFGLETRRTRLELTEFTDAVEAKARKESWVRVATPAGVGYVLSQRRPVIAPADRARLEALRDHLRSAEFRGALAGQFVMRGGWILLWLGAGHVLLLRFERRATPVAG